MTVFWWHVCFFVVMMRRVFDLICTILICLSASLSKVGVQKRRYLLTLVQHLTVIGLALGRYQVLVFFYLSDETY